MHNPTLRQKKPKKQTGFREFQFYDASQFTREKTPDFIPRKETRDLSVGPQNMVYNLKATQQNKSRNIYSSQKKTFQPGIFQKKKASFHQGDDRIDSSFHSVMNMSSFDKKPDSRKNLRMDRTQLEGKSFIPEIKGRNSSLQNYKSMVNQNSSVLSVHRQVLNSRETKHNNYMMTEPDEKFEKKQPLQNVVLEPLNFQTEPNEVDHREDEERLETEVQPVQTRKKTYKRKNLVFTKDGKYKIPIKLKQPDELEQNAVYLNDSKHYKRAIPLMLKHGTMSQAKDKAASTTGGVEVEFGRLGDGGPLRDLLAGTTHLEYLRSNKSLKGAPLKVEGDAAGKIELVSPPIYHLPSNAAVLQDHWKRLGKSLTNKKTLGGAVATLNEVIEPAGWSVSYQLADLEKSVLNPSRGTGSIGPYKMGYYQKAVTLLKKANLEQLPITPITVMMKNEQAVFEVKRPNIHFNQAFKPEVDKNYLEFFVTGGVLEDPEQIVNANDIKRYAMGIMSPILKGAKIPVKGMVSLAVRQFLDSTVNGAIFAPYQALKRDVKQQNYIAGVEKQSADQLHNSKVGQKNKVGFDYKNANNVSNYDSNYKDRSKVYYKIAWEHVTGDLPTDTAERLLTAFENVIVQAKLPKKLQEVSFAHWSSRNKNLHNPGEEGKMQEAITKAGIDYKKEVSKYLDRVEDRIREMYKMVNGRVIERDALKEQSEERDLTFKEKEQIRSMSNQAIPGVGELYQAQRDKKDSDAADNSPLGVRPDTFLYLGQGEYLKEIRQGGYKPKSHLDADYLEKMERFQPDNDLTSDGDDA